MNSSIHDLLAEGTRALAAAGITEPRRDAALLLGEVLNRDRSFMIAHPEHSVAADQLQKFREFIARRASGEPLQYITAHQEFFKLDFAVTPDVLIPRPETELIVEVALEILRPDQAARLLDIGTGSGCLAISILKELPKARAVATDISASALKVARRNAERHGVTDRLRLIESDLFSAMASDDVFDLLVSNPPYVPNNDLRNLQPEVQYEPAAALAGGADGLATIRRILRDAPRLLCAGGYLIFEIGFGQSESVGALVGARDWQMIEIRRDLQGIPRTVVVRRK